MGVCELEGHLGQIRADIYSFRGRWRRGSGLLLAENQIKFWIARAFAFAYGKQVIKVLSIVVVVVVVVSEHLHPVSAVEGS